MKKNNKVRNAIKKNWFKIPKKTRELLPFNMLSIALLIGTLVFAVAKNYILAGVCIFIMVLVALSGAAFVRRND